MNVKIANKMDKRGNLKQRDRYLANEKITKRDEGKEEAGKEKGA